MAKRKSKSKKKVKELRFDKKKSLLWKFFHLHWGKSLILIGFWILFLGFHNFSSEIFGIEEPVLFLIPVILIPLYFAAAIIHTITDNIISKRKIKNQNRRK